jgi:PIN domain nuclease of toxin-antitoxin system
MRLLLDTCALLWLVGDPAQLSEAAQTALASGQTTLCVSAISAFEIAVKHRKGKLVLPLPPRSWLHRAIADYDLVELPITSEIAAMAPEVAVSHADPCDRMIIATALLHRLPIVTSDRLIADCTDVNVLW